MGLISRVSSRTYRCPLGTLGYPQRSVSLVATFFKATVLRGKLVNTRTIQLHKYTNFPMDRLYARTTSKVIVRTETNVNLFTKSLKNLNLENRQSWSTNLSP